MQKEIFEKNNGVKKHMYGSVPEWAWQALSLVLTIAITAAAVRFAGTYIYINANIPTQSMCPSLDIGTKLIGNRVAYVLKEPERYDVIIFEYPDNESVLYIKRVIGLPGDTIDIRDRDVYVNGEKTEDGFCAEPSSTETGNISCPFTVPDGCYFVLGDNREHSIDSRFWKNTFVKKEEIKAKALFKFYPLSQAGPIK